MRAAHELTELPRSLLCRSNSLPGTAVSEICLILLTLVRSPVFGTGITTLHASRNTPVLIERFITNLS